MAFAADAQPTYRVFVSTDLGGDPDDIQSLYRLLHYSDHMAVEGIISSPGPGAENAAEKIRRWIREVRVDEMRANGHPELITEERGAFAGAAGADRAGAPARGPRHAGSRLLIERALAHDPRGTGRCGCRPGGR